MMSWYSFFTTGDPVGAEFCLHDIPERLDPFDNEAFKTSATHFYVTCTIWIPESRSTYGCSDSIPVCKFLEMGCGTNMVVLTRPMDCRRKSRRPISGAGGGCDEKSPCHEPLAGRGKGHLTGQNHVLHWVHKKFTKPNGL